MQALYRLSLTRYKRACSPLSHRRLWDSTHHRRDLWAHQDSLSPHHLRIGGKYPKSPVVREICRETPRDSKCTLPLRQDPCRIHSWANHNPWVNRYTIRSTQCSGGQDKAWSLVR